MLVNSNAILPTYSQLQIITFHFTVILPLKKEEKTIICVCVCSQEELKGSFQLFLTMNKKGFFIQQYPKPQEMTQLVTCDSFMKKKKNPDPVNSNTLSKAL